MATQLSVRARADILVLDVEFARATGHRRYVGRVAMPYKKEEELPEGEPHHLASNQFLPPGEKPLLHYAYPKSSSPEVVPGNLKAKEYAMNLAYYVRAIRDGELWAADAATAAHCGVPFDPTFGGEFVAKDG